MKVTGKTICPKVSEEKYTIEGLSSMVNMREGKKMANLVYFSRMAGVMMVTSKMINYKALEF